jgi:hypothetical protein
MADQKISELPEKFSLADSDYLPIVDTESSPFASKKTTVAALTSIFGTNLVGATGVTGAVGPAGATGAAGSTGPAPTVTDGPTADSIYIGGVLVEAAQGPTGPAGAQGEIGPTGPAGDAGPQGATGVVGATGPAGPTGSAGVTGATGPQGETGPQGPAGIDTTYEFTLNYTGSLPTSALNLPAGWSASISANDVTITHTAGRQIKDVTYWGYTAGTDLWHARYPTAANELTMDNDTKMTAFTIRVSNTVVGCDSGGNARIVCFF